ncbi:hypothetical protein FBZ87_11310 [Nitrospirillum amazonense]|uniref:Uncharacterized protein n=1 Tax=Nitrospirillum amazonense TaxID=28077 RepID=A0A560J9A0_9PROT|nr:hypothetical protein FBZ87_11310 [Nitrospirillum amazonense]
MFQGGKEDTTVGDTVPADGGASTKCTGMKDGTAGVSSPFLI